MPIDLTPIPAGDRPVTWAEAKAHLRLDDDTQQAYVESLIDAATDYAEERLAATLMQRTRTVKFYDGANLLKLPRGPLVSITSITDDTSKVITDYDISAVGNADFVTVNESFTAPLTVVYVAGHGSASAIAASIRQAILMHVHTLFECRASVNDKNKLIVPHGYDAFLQLKSRKVPVG